MSDHNLDLDAEIPELGGESGLDDSSDDLSWGEAELLVDDTSASPTVEAAPHDEPAEPTDAEDWAESEDDIEMTLDAEGELHEEPAAHPEESTADSYAFFEVPGASAALGDPIEAVQSMAPPERVRFAAPITLQVQGSERTYDSAVVNLSINGVACLAPVDLEPGDEVWGSFRLSLGVSPLSILCEVIWKRPPQHDHWAYGLRFKGLNHTEEHSLREAVRERTEGRAGAWPLPVVDNDPDMDLLIDDDEPFLAAGVAARPTSPWMSAAAGMAAGIGLSLALSVIPDAAGAFSTPAMSEPVHSVVASRVARQPGEPLAEPRNEPRAEAEPPDEPQNDPTEVEAAAAEKAPPVVYEAPAPVAAPRRGSDLKPEPKLLPRRAPTQAMAGGEEVLRPVGTADFMPLALLADGPVEQHITFWLSGPKRLVVDIPGRQSGFARKSYQIDHPLASRMRVGNHPGKVRFVLETSEDVAAEVHTAARGDALVLEIRRR